MELLVKLAKLFVLSSAFIFLQTAPHQSSRRRHHVKAHQQALFRRLAHHCGEDHGVDLRRCVFHGKTRVSISLRFNAADYLFKYSVSQPVAIKFSTSASCRSDCDSFAQCSLERMRSSLLTTHNSKSATRSRMRRVNSCNR